VPADSLERVFTLIEMNAARVPVFRKFVAGDPLDAGDVAELERAVRELGMFDFARFIHAATPEVMTAIAQAENLFERARTVRSIWSAVFGESPTGLTLKR
jgi:uncharacterized protein with von Willebrand factor type A (vWA) domain